MKKEDEIFQIRLFLSTSLFQKSETTRCIMVSGCFELLQLLNGSSLPSPQNCFIVVLKLCLSHWVGCWVICFLNLPFTPKYYEELLYFKSKIKGSVTVVRWTNVHKVTLGEIAKKALFLAEWKFSFLMFPVEFFTIKRKRLKNFLNLKTDVWFSLKWNPWNWVCTYIL